jgi:hypothetical protein
MLDAIGFRIFAQIRSGIYLCPRFARINCQPQVERALELRELQPHVPWGAPKRAIAHGKKNEAVLHGIVIRSLTKKHWLEA